MGVAEGLRGKREPTELLFAKRQVLLSASPRHYRVRVGSVQGCSCSLGYDRRLVSLVYFETILSQSVDLTSICLSPMNTFFLSLCARLVCSVTHYVY